MSLMTDDLKEKVEREAIALKVHVTREECSRLNFGGLDSNSSARYIYGQMTLDCFSERATELLNLCAAPFTGDLFEFRAEYLPVNFKRYGRAFSPIEFYISQTQAENEILIQFLRGERETLTAADL